ncbi:hypothetical protein [Planomonospora parontospora]|uniref:hypothetical protein n=1 Tax=Planomonospora parontospora TaxID=58119 RepID=UPI00166FD022|nr:hypothetical protein [Planomonospora parontospora]GGL55310.1 hypothetical protein GCM10014719_65740 [Planomonospora parontospora subsp. antibiotica]GII19800.1 hypothetical protein Ppa05_65260 [Planomonospora parontospora subsp. antibiotica]
MIFNNRAAARRERAAAYARHVVAVLAPHVPDLQHPQTAAIVTTAIEQQLGTPHASWEAIIDSAYVANWRLRPAEEAGQVRVACCRPSLSATDRAREAELTALINQGAP